jgi:hypothetical protein
MNELIRRMIQTNAQLIGSKATNATNKVTIDGNRLFRLLLLKGSKAK